MLLVLGQTTFGQGLLTFDELLKFNFTSSDSLALLLLDAKQDYILKDKGLRFNSSFGTNEFGDLENGNILRVKAGFEWNLLDEGFMDRKISAKVTEVEKEIKKIELNSNVYDRNYVFLYNHIIYCFNKEKLKYLNEKDYLLKYLTIKYEALYHSHAADFQELISLYDQSEEVNILQLALSNYNNHFEKLVQNKAPELQPNYLPVLDIDVDKLFNFQRQDTTLAYLKSLKIQKNELEDKLSKQKRLAIYNNVYWRPLQEAGTTKFLYNGFGIRFSTDLVNRNDEKDRINELNNSYDIQKQEELHFNNQKELSNFLLEYNAKLRSYSKYIYKLKSLEEDKRLDKAVRVINVSTPQSDLNSMNIDLERLTIEYELLELKQQLYLLLLKIYLKSEVNSILSYISERDGTKEIKKLKGDRLLKLAGNFNQEAENQFLIQYLLKNEFFNVVLNDLDGINLNFKKKLIESKIRVFPSIEALNYREIIEVPVLEFANRIEMEYWIKNKFSNNNKAFFLFTGTNQLLNIDSLTLED